MKLHKESARLFGWELLHIRKDQPTLDSHLKQLFARLGVDCVLDVGANQGQYGAMLRKAGYKGRIVSFEPVKATFAQLKARAAGDPDWRLFNCALGAKAGEQEIHVTRSTVFASFLDPNEFSRRKYPDAMPVQHSEKVRIRTLDEVLPEAVAGLKAPKLFLKLDTQGFDLQVFAGAKATVPKVLGMQTELSIQAIYEDMPDYLEALGTYTKAGFVMSGLYPVSRDRDTLALIELDCVMRRVPAPEKKVIAKKPAGRNPVRKKKRA
ncbi:MAG TPA: FkbM family methyltransferase [Gammaproteobacteria bacterium]|jgi:FkbM family methyltransferase|nr:FkbM family methyltransferase [Gammaproteobacteria bacterium]